MADHMTSSEKTGTGSSSITTVTDALGSDLDLWDLCNRVKVLEQNAGSTIQSDSYVRSRIRQLERSERSLLLQLSQLASASQLPSMQHSHKLDQRLHMLREEVRTMTQEKEQGERVWRERLQRCQRQLKSKEEEMSRQSQYFENFKTQLQHKLSLARDREQSLQKRIYTLEKQLLDMTVSAATDKAAISAVRITAGTTTHWDEQERLTFMRGQGEGEEEQKEERKKQWQPSVGNEREGGCQGDEGKTEKETEGTRQSSNEARLQGFILSLQQDLRVLLEREEDGMTEQRRLMEQLHEAQENSHFLSCQVEEMKTELHQLKVSESSLVEEVEQLRETNHRLRQILREAANQTPGQPSTIPESTYPSPGTSSSSSPPAVCPVSSNTPAMGRSSVGSLGEVELTFTKEIHQSHSSAVPPVHHQATAETTQINTHSHSSSAKSDLMHLFASRGSKPNPSFQSLTLTTETVDEFKLGVWCSRGIFNLEESPSEESDALREAYRSLGMQEDLEAFEEQRCHLETVLQPGQEQLQVITQENAPLKLQLKQQVEEGEAEAEQRLSVEKISPPSLHQPSSTQHNTILTLAQEDLVQALNQENRALADRIQELLAHIELREEEIKREETQWRDHICRVEQDRDRLEQENQEQGCLITELTRKTEDDLNTIMELQQKLEESGEQHSVKECVDGLVEHVLKEEELHSSQQTTTPAPLFLHNHNNPIQSSPQNTLHVSSLTDQVDQLTKSIQTLKTEEEELSGYIKHLREQQREVALSVQTQTEEKQLLTRTVWGLKEEKDSISQSLAGLKQEKEELSRTVCGLKDGRDQLVRSMSGLEEEKEQLTKTLSSLEREKEAFTESLSSGKEERDQIMQSLQSLQRESDQLRQAVLNLNQEKDELTSTLKLLKEQRDQEHLSYNLQEQLDKLSKSVSSLREEKESIEHSISSLKQEENQLLLVIQGLKEEANSLRAAHPSQTQTEERNQKQLLLTLNGAGVTNKTESLTGTGDCSAQRRQTHNNKGNSIQNISEQQEHSELMREVEALGAQITRSREELDKSRVEIKKLHSDLCQSEVRREEAEREATQSAEHVMRLTDVANQMEETRKENEGLNTKVKELQSKLTGLVREKADTLSLKTQIEEQYYILTAQLKAKTVALEELNSEYIALKQAQGNKDELSSVLMSLRARYNDIRAKYDALLKRKSQTDLDIAPLKAKLSCLVAKCQERNSLLVQMMKAMHTHGCVDSTLTQQVEQLLSDVALQDYTAAFTPGSNIKMWDYSGGFISKFHVYTKGFTPDQSFPAVQHQNGFTSGSGVKCRDLKGEKHTFLVTSESTVHLQDCTSEVTHIPGETLKKNDSSTVPDSPEQEHSTVQVSLSPVPPLTADLSTNKTQLSPSPSGPGQAASDPEKCGFYHTAMKGKSWPDLTNSTDSSLTSTPPPCNTCVSPNRRLNSPEKIIGLHEQLQKMMSSYQSPVSRGRGQPPRKSLSLSASADLSLASPTKKQNFSFNNAHASSLPVTTAASQAKHTPVVTAKPVATNKSATLFNAVASRAAHITFSPNTFTCHKADVPTTTTSAHASSSNFAFGTLAPNKAKSISNSDTNKSVSPKPARTLTASDSTHTVSTPLTPRATSFDSPILMYSDTNLKTAASDTTASSISAASKVNIFNMTSKMDGAGPAYDGFASAASCIQSAHRSPERSSKFAQKSTAASERTNKARPTPEAPAEVRSVEVIKTVGQSSLMIGWERPPLDELGCSNGTFVYGYRVFIDGDFHKSVMSSACTKCILENVDLSVLVHISVQTLGSNGLCSNRVHTRYRTSVRTEQQSGL
ncbi:coiled-coil domain-containing protein 136-like isoform X2 [Mastacembelus armatus]|uniref:coiled-coil domain-containing protein 136-like isoform X2 n=1 Tax=Mastacembelus armatus TaxID=205130 RepID=UPI000E454D68|nr:coiled-coil domain-containing protein 136-like isoform X2 [Mastacembelus armatus]